MTLQQTHIPRKRFGQNFLVDRNVIEKIVRAFNPHAGEHIVEIGPGKGALTTPLLTIAKHLYVIELDRDLLPSLENQCRDIGKLKIYQSDVLKFDFNQIETPPHQLRIIGNLPYNISTPLLFHLLKYIDCIKDMHFMLQKEVVDRLAAKPGTAEYGRLSVMIQFHCNVEPLFSVGPRSFQPPPKVESTVARFIPLKQEHRPPVNQAQFANIVKQAFSHRRKTLRNNLKTLLREEQILNCEIDPNIRAEYLDINAFIRLANALDNNI